MRQRTFFQFPYLIRALLAFVGMLPWVLAAFDSHALRPLFKGFCHQMPERSLIILGAPMAVCSRCAGIYSGIAIGALTPPLDFMERHGRTIIWFALVIALSDFVVQNFVLHSMNHASRIATGAIAGWAASAFLFSSLEKAKAPHPGYGEN